jgi:hypothetical protein
MQHLNTPIEYKLDDGDEGTFEGYASVFDELDNGMDIVAKGAFTESLQSGHKVKMLWQHDQGQPIGIWESIQEDDKGLRVKGRLLAGVQKGREALELMRAGALDSMSIGYQAKEIARENGGAVRRLLAVKLFEISVVTFPMLDSANVTAVKSITTIRDLEKTLRDAGFSQAEAKGIAARGFDGLNARRDGEAEGQAAESIKSYLESLQGLKENISHA